MVELTKGRDGCIVTRFLATKLDHEDVLAKNVFQRVGSNQLTWLQGNPRITNPRPLYLSYSPCRPIELNEGIVRRDRRE